MHSYIKIPDGWEVETIADETDRIPLAIVKKLGLTGDSSTLERRLIGAYLKFTSAKMVFMLQK